MVIVEGQSNGAGSLILPDHVADTECPFVGPVLKLVRRYVRGDDEARRPAAFAEEYSLEAREEAGIVLEQTLLDLVPHFGVGFAVILVLPRREAQTVSLLEDLVYLILHKGLDGDVDRH